MARSTAHINEDPAFQRRFWIAQRAAWLLLAALVVAALAGVTGGGGPFAMGRVGGDGFRLEYPVFARRQAGDEVTITVDGTREATMLHLEQAFLDRFRIVGMSPAPSDQVATPWGQAYRFRLSGAGERTIRLGVVPVAAGRSDYAVVVDGQMALLSTFVLP